MEKVFETVLSIDNPVIRGHVVHGQSVLPGLAYIDLLYQLARQALEVDHASYALRRVTIFHPLVVRPERPVRLEIVFADQPDGWSVRVDGFETGASERKVYVTAELRTHSETWAQDLPVEAVRQGARRHRDLESIYAECRERHLVHQGEIKARGDVYLTGSGLLAELRVDDRHQEEVSAYLFHPALIDGAAVAIYALDGIADSGELFIPLSYEEFYAVEPLQTACFASVDMSSLRKKNDVRALDITFYSRAGKRVAQLKGFTSKKVRSEGHFDAEPSKAYPRAAAEPVAASNGDLEASLRAIFARHLNVGLAEISLDTVFFEMGLQSSQLLSVVKDIEAQLSLSLSPTLLFETNSLRELITELAAKVKPGAGASTQSKRYVFYGDEPYLQDHRVLGKPALMGVTHPSLALEAYLQGHSYPVELRGVEFVGGPITLEATERAEISVHLREENGSTRFQTDHFVNDPADRKVCCQGVVARAASPAADTFTLAAMLQQARPVELQTVAGWYEAIPGFQIGSMLRTIKEAYRVDESTLLMKVSLAGRLQKGSVTRLAFDPLLLNTCYMVFHHVEARKRENIFVPLAIERLTVHGPMTETGYVVSKIRSVRDGFVSFDAAILTEQGERIAEVSNASMREVVNPSMLANASFEEEAPRAGSAGALDVAIVGVSGRYPQAFDVNAFWDNLRQGKDCITEIPKDRWSWQDYYAEDRAQPGSVYSKWGGFIEDHDRFDPVFFNIAPRDAELMDPQERLFLEHSWMALEDAGYTREALQRSRKQNLPVRIGVYAGVMSQEYPLFAAEASLQGQRIGLPSGVSGIAARVSYFFNLNGPSMAVDTMCSSSLTTIYLACQALKDRKIDAALAGGVNVSLHPNKYLMLSQGQFISSKGHCESFGVGGDGYIPGEGVGVLFLKRLSDAINDRDHIYGVIKGAAINHGGKASGFTVPNPKAQSLVVSQAIEESGFDPRTISYIEAHGTGTQLGDPIEITGLTEAFGRGRSETQYCRIGSAKSNVGHCEAAAGVAGVTKVLLQMKHGQIVPSLHSAVLNPNINFNATPFRVNQELRPWERPLVDGKEQRRRAGISSFGAGGSNAHLIIEEFVPSAAERPHVAVGPVAIVLSARDRDRLSEQARALLKAAREWGWTDADLANIAYTLQVGREEMEERLAFTAATLQELAEKLSLFLDGGGAGVYRGRVKRQGDVAPALASEELSHVLQLWVQGLKYDWNRLYGRDKPRRISLPTYPFARERYWLPVTGAKGGVAVAAAIHPLLHRNTSGLKGLRFSSTFTGQEPLLAENVVNGARLMPGAAYLEMARKAVVHAGGLEDGAPLRLEDVEWSQPLVVGDGEKTVHVGLVEREDGRVEFDIYTGSQDGEAALHCQGSAVLLSAEPARTVDLAAARAKCHGNREIHVGALQSLQEGDGLALARVVLPTNLATLADFVLHPSLLAAAFHAAAGLRTSVAAASVKELTLYGRCTSEMWAIVRSVEGGVDVDLCDGEGHLVVAVKGLSFEERAKEETFDGSVLLQAVWEPVPISKGAITPLPTARAVIIGGTAAVQDRIREQLPGAQPLNLGGATTLEELARAFERAGAIEHLIWIAPEVITSSVTDERVLTAQEQGVLGCFQTIRALLRLKYDDKPLHWTVITTQAQPVQPREQIQPAHSGLHGLIGTLAKEYPQWSVRLVDLEAGQGWPFSDLFRLPADPQGNALAYRNGQWFQQTVTRFQGDRANGDIYRQGGVYVVLGGAGGLGEVWSEYMVRTYQAQLVWIGRRPKDATIQGKIDRLSAHGPAPLYVSADAADEKSLRRAHAEIKERYPRIHGLVHSAIGPLDHSLSGMELEQFRAVLAPKVDLSVRMAQVFAREGLDLVLFFSSINSFGKDPGKSGYSAGSVFEDAFAHQLALEWPCKVKVMNWGLWDGTGSAGYSPESHRKRLAAAGLGGIEPAEAMEGLNRLLGSTAPQAALIKTTRPVSLGELLRKPEARSVEPVEQGRPLEMAATGPLREKSTAYFKKLVGETLKLPLQRIDTSVRLEEYGIDSVFIMQMNRVLGQVFGKISSTLFFEYPTIDALVEYFMEKHRDALAKHLGATVKAPAPVQGGGPEKKPRRLRTAAPRAAVGRAARASEPIAIIGMSGRYPQARNLREYWENLRAGRDSVTEIPEDRWPLDGFFHPDMAEAVELRKSYSKWGAFIDGFAQFDPLFFNISPTDALNMDPQERLFIAACWEVFEDAGYTREQLHSKFGGRVGVIAGMTRTGFNLLGPDQWAQGEVVHPRTSFASAANRVSYLLDLKGPSLPVDTMCSSSLTAIHMACEHIHRGDCEMAVAGGVNMYLHPSNYIELSAMQMLSTDGRCKSFGDDGNGFVPGEGVGVVLLKRLSQAIADGDHIYAVIRATEINHGGKTNGYTVPNPSAQGKLIRQALDKAGVNARAVSYIEAHGTGTRLGDPIEITGLQHAFERDTKDVGFCAIGSVKSNIGHLEAAAGIASLTKVVLQMRHGQLVPSLHARTLNPNIDFASTPFVVQQDLAEWPRPVLEFDGKRREFPRIAGISSFGAGGANAHVVLEEYVSAPRGASASITEAHPAIIVLSARNRDRLNAYARTLAEAIRERPLTDADLADVAYTLQIGREAMGERLAFTVTSMRELEEKLTRFAAGQEDIEGLYLGQLKRDRDVLSVFATDEDMALTINAWLAKGKYGKVLDLWVKGLEVDWNKLHGDPKPQRISLPTYPFVGDVYWFSKPAGQRPAPSSQAQVAMIHPLLHRNTSDLSKQEFTSILTGQESFLSDHWVAGKSVLPGVAYLEMARAAVETSAGFMKKGRAAVKLRDVAWSRPVVVNGEPVTVNISLALEDGGKVSYEISSKSGERGEATLHGQGSALLVPVEEVPVLDLAALRATCGRGLISSERVYGAFADMGIDYGPSHRCVSEVHVGSGELLAKLSLPATLWEEGRYVIHPGILDSAIQASLGFVLVDAGSEAPRKPIMPFALDEAEIFSPCAASMWAYIAPAEGSRATDKVQKFDITLCDEQGRVAVRLNGLSSRVMRGEVSSRGEARKIMLAPVWEAFAPRRAHDFPSRSARVWIAGGTADQVRAIQQRFPDSRVLELSAADTIANVTRQLQAHGPIDHLVWIAPESPIESIVDESIIEEQARGIFPLFRTVKALLALGYETKELGWTVVTTWAQRVHRDDPVNPTHATFHGFIGSMAKEFPAWSVRLLDMAGEGSMDDLFTLPPDPQGNALAYRDKQWYRQTLVPITELPTGRGLYRQGGVYVVIGGAGGIGEIWSEYMIRTYQAHVVWIGRREKDANIQAKLDRLAQIGPAPLYIAADAADRAALQAAYEQIKQRHPQVHGLVHSALLLLDKGLLNMDEERFKAGLAPKVEATVHMAQVFAAEPIDFVLYFSSMNAFVKASGQSNYSAGCTFKDAYALRMAQAWRCAVKVMDWGYWGSVGTVASKEYQERMAQRGVGSIEPPEAMEALDTLLTGPLEQVAFIKAIDAEQSYPRLGEENVEAYPETTTSAIEGLKKRIVIPPAPRLSGSPREWPV